MEVFVIRIRLSGPWTVSAFGGGGPKEASPISVSLLVLGAFMLSTATALSVSLLIRGSSSAPSFRGLIVLGLVPSDGGLESVDVGVSASAASLDRLEIGV